MQPTILMALQDYVPVLISLVAFYWIAQMARFMNENTKVTAAVGLVFIASSGCLKATEKLIWAATGEEVLWMRHSLFILNSVGFTFIAWTVWRAQKSQTTNGLSVLRVPSIFAVIIIALISYAAFMLPGRTWFFIALAAASLANFTMIFFLIRHSIKVESSTGVGLYSLYIVVLIAMVFLSKSPSVTNQFEWIKQSANTVAAIIFALASRSLLSQTKKQDAQMLRTV